MLTILGSATAPTHFDSLMYDVFICLDPTKGTKDMTEELIGCKKNAL